MVPPPVLIKTTLPLALSPQYPYNPPMTYLLGQIFALLTAACWAHNSIAYTLAGRRVGSSATTHIRLWIALPALLIIHQILLGTPFPFSAPPAALTALALSGLIGFFIADILIFRAFLDIGPRETMVIMTLSPIFAALLSWIFLGEGLTPPQLTGIAVTLSGIIAVILVRTDGGSGPRSRQLLQGLLAAFLGAATQGAGMVLARSGLDYGISPVSGNTVRVAAGLAGLILFAALRGQFRQDFRRMADRRALLWIASGALIGPVLGMGLSLYAMTAAPVGIVTTLMQVSPIFLLPADRWIFHKKIPPAAAGGTLLAVAGTALLILW